MKSHASVFAVTLLAVGSLTISNAAVELQHNSGREPLGQPVPLPQPRPEEFTPPAMDTFQLVGFTKGAYEGNRGALNLTLVMASASLSLLDVSPSTIVSASPSAFAAT